jgi:hypothetical protein
MATIVKGTYLNLNYDQKISAASCFRWCGAARAGAGVYTPIASKDGYRWGFESWSVPMDTLFILGLAAVVLPWAFTPGRWWERLALSAGALAVDIVCFIVLEGIFLTAIQK